MNVIIANEAKSMLSTLDIDVIKSVDGVHTADEIVEMFKNFFYARMILEIIMILLIFKRYLLVLMLIKSFFYFLIMRHLLLVVIYLKLFLWGYITLLQQ